MTPTDAPPTVDLHLLRVPFAAEDIEWKPIAVSKKTGKALAAAYLTNRAIMDRLDEACGPGYWRNEFRPGPCGGLLCGLSILVPLPDGSLQWVTKWDGADNTDVEPVKGGLSSSMRRAAVQWGIGRYLYRLPNQWVPIDERGRFSQHPSIPPAFLPPRRPSGDGASSRAAPTPAPPQQTQSRTGRNKAAPTPAPPQQTQSRTGRNQAAPHPNAPHLNAPLPGNPHPNAPRGGKQRRS